MNKLTKILVVDDSEIVRINILHLLNEDFDEANIFFADTIDKAWNILTNNEIDIVLVDIYLPGKNGTDLINDMLIDKDLKHIPIIVITGMNKNSFVKSSYEKYVYAYFNKPINKKRLLSSIKKVISI